MDELRLEGVHDDGEHLVLSDSSGRRSLLAVDQQLRQAVQRARRAPARRARQGAEFGPRDIQARFRSGASLEEIVEESGWEPERVRRYEWPILDERAHMARQAQKVELGTRRTEGYRSAFEGAPLTLSQTLETRAPDLGIAASSFDWDAWQRPDLLWTVAVRFRLVDPAKAPQDLVDQQAMAQWVFNPASLSVSAEPGWAEHLTVEERPRDGVFGESRSPRGTVPAAQASPDAPSAASPSAQEVAEPAPSGSADVVEPLGGDEASRSTEELLEVLDARRGQRLGTDEDSDDQLAAILGRSMGHVDPRPRPISAPDDAQLFRQTIQTGRPAGAQQTDQQDDQQDDQQAESGGDGDAASAERAASPQASEGSRSDPQAPSGDHVDGDRAPEPSEQAEAGDPAHHHEATIHHLGRADAGTAPDSDIVEITDDDDARMPAQPTPLRPVPADPADAADPDADQDPSAADRADSSSGSAAEGRADAEQEGSETKDGSGAGSGAEQDEADARPRPRGRVGGGKRTRSSVPSWDDIVFGAKND